MINFPCSTFTWKKKPWKPHPYYRNDGGFVGNYGDVYHVRFNIDAKCDVRDESTGKVTELFLGAPCRGEYTIASENLFVVPSTEFRMAFSRTSRISLARRASTEEEEVVTGRLSDAYLDYKIDLRECDDYSELKDSQEVIEATLRNDLLNAQSTYRDPDRGLIITVEYPINLINLNQADGKFQVCTGPVLLPDLDTWDGIEVTRAFLAEAAFSSFNNVEFILRCQVDPSNEDKKWLHQVRGRDRWELTDPNNKPPGHPPPGPTLPAYNEVWEIQSKNAVIRAENR